MPRLLAIMDLYLVVATRMKLGSNNAKCRNLPALKSLFDGNSKLSKPTVRHFERMAKTLQSWNPTGFTAMAGRSAFTDDACRRAKTPRNFMAILDQNGN